MASGSKDFGKRIKELREARNLTQEQLAEMVGLEYQTISRIETGYYFTNFENLKNIANALNTDIKDLFDFEHIKLHKDLKNEIKNKIDHLSDKQLYFVNKILNAANELSAL